MPDPLKLADEIERHGLLFIASVADARVADTIVRALRSQAPASGDVPHWTHDLRSSDASTFDVVCERCGHTDQTPGGWGKLTEPCPASSPSGDVRERVGRAIADHIHRDGDWGLDGEAAFEARRDDFIGQADAALSALRPGDEVGGCVLVPQSKEPDWWYCDIDPDECGGTAYEAMFDHRPRLVPVELRTSYVGPTMWGVMAPACPGALDDSETAHVFDTKEEAAAFCAERARLAKEAPDAD